MATEGTMLVGDGRSLCVREPSGVVRILRGWPEGTAAAGLAGFQTVAAPHDLTAIAVFTDGGPFKGQVFDEERTTLVGAAADRQLLAVDVTTTDPAVDQMWRQLGHLPGQGPATALEVWRDPEGSLHVIVAQTDGVYVVRVDDGDQPQLGWRRLADLTDVTSISVLVDSPDSLIVALVDKVKGLVALVSNGISWRPWQHLPGLDGVTPRAVSLGVVGGRQLAVVTTVSGEAVLLTAHPERKTEKLGVISPDGNRSPAVLQTWPGTRIVAIVGAGKLCYRQEFGTQWSTWTRSVAPDVTPESVEATTAGSSTAPVTEPDVPPVESPEPVTQDAPAHEGASSNELGPALAGSPDPEPRPEPDRTEPPTEDATLPQDTVPPYVESETEHLEVDVDETQILGTEVLPLTDDDPESIGGFTLHGRYPGGSALTVKYRARRLPQGWVFLKVVASADTPGINQQARLAVLDDLEREAEHLRRLPRHHANVVLLVDSGETDDGRRWIALKLLSGIAMSKQANRTRTWEQVWPFAIQLLEGIDVTLDAGIVHGDIKPENIHILSNGSTPVITDYGASLVLGEPRRSIRQVTPKWAAPELMDPSGDPTGTTDLFSWALVVAQFATGRFPFATYPTDPGRGGEVHRRRREGSAPQLEELAAGPRKLLTDCWAQDPGDRPSVKSVLARLRELAPHEATKESGSTGPFLGSQIDRMGDWIDETQRESRRRFDNTLIFFGSQRAPVHIVFLLLVLLVAVWGGLLSGQVFYGLVRS